MSLRWLTIATLVLVVVAGCGKSGGGDAGAWPDMRLSRDLLRRDAVSAHDGAARDGSARDGAATDGRPTDGSRRDGPVRDARSTDGLRRDGRPADARRGDSGPTVCGAWSEWKCVEDPVYLCIATCKPPSGGAEKRLNCLNNGTCSCVLSVGPCGTFSAATPCEVCRQAVQKGCCNP